MTQDNEPQKVDGALFEEMARLSVSLPMSGHELGALCFVLETAIESGNVTLAKDLAPHHRETTENLQRAVLSLKARVDTALTYLSIAATANLAAVQDNVATAPSTPRPQ